MNVPDWAIARLSLDRICREEFEPDEYFQDVENIFKQSLPENIVQLVQLSSTRSSVEVLFERRKQSSIVIWDVDFFERLDGMFALIFSDPDETCDFHGMGMIAYSNLTASTFLHDEPEVSQYILKISNDFLPDTNTVIVEDDIRMDRYRRLARVYIALHELAHIIYRLLPEQVKEIDELIQSIVKAIPESQLLAKMGNQTKTDERFASMGLLANFDEVQEIENQIREHLTIPKDYEEIWCDVFANKYMLSWAEDHGFKPEECVVIDELIHLVLAGRLQWQCFWDRKNNSQIWDNASELSNHESRANIRGLFLANISLRSWYEKTENQGLSKAEASDKYSDIVSAEGDSLKMRFVERNYLALGILGGLDRHELFENAIKEWTALSVKEQKNSYKKILSNLS